MIAGIVSIIVLILLVIFVVGFLFYTKRFCFATPIVTIAPSESKETGEMIIQTDPANGKLISKYYSGGVSTETEPLLGQALQTQTDLGDTEPDIGKQKECDYSVDQTKEYCYEGNGSLAGSLSSIQSEPESIDLEAEFRALGRPFKKLAELYTDADDDIVVSDSSSDDSTLDSFKIVDESTANNSEVEV